ncbi:hypothetical protein HDU98_004140, partial [Podochytrium sp. JEL0797]
MLGQATSFDSLAISEYELQREQRILEQNKMLRDLGLTPTPTNPDLKPKVPAKRKRPTKPEVVESKPATRFSLRSRGVKAESPAEAEATAAAESLAADSQPQGREYRIKGDIDFSFDKDHPFEALVGSLDKVLSEEGESLSVASGSSADLKSPIAGSVKVTKEMVFSIAVHPSKDRILSLVGDKLGNLSLVDISQIIQHGRDSQEKLIKGEEDVSELEPVLAEWKPFKKPISKIVYNHSDLNKVLLSSYDGSIRLMDIESRKFTEVFVHPDDDMVSHFDVGQSAHLLWVSDGLGSAALVDTRVPVATSPSFFDLSEKKINTIHWNPTDQNYIAIGGLDRTVKVFDVRNMKPSVPGDEDLVEPVMTLPHRLSVNSAYWDPSGKDIISTSFDDTLGLWKNVLVEKESGLVKIRHNNNTGRWVQKFKAVWRGQDSVHYHASSVAPYSPTLVIGNMQRTVDLYDGDKGMQIASLQESSLTAIPAVNVFHPFLNVIVSGNASGRMN